VLDPDPNRSSPPSPLTPLAGSERVELLDVLRGFALFGILLVNMAMFSAPFYLAMSSEKWFSAPVDRAVELLILALGQGKFYSLFAMLFGVGLAIQLRRAEIKGVRPHGFLARRMAWLLVIGVVHALLIWFGDILAMYAVVGFAMLPFLYRRNRTLVVWTVICLLLPLVFFAVIVAATGAARLVPAAAAELAEQEETQRQEIAEAIETARESYLGSYRAATVQRARDAGMLWSFSVVFLPNVLALFLVGFNVGRRRVLERVHELIPRIRRAMPWLLLVGIAGNSMLVVGTVMNANPTSPSAWNLLGQLGSTFGAPALTLFYVSVIVVILHRPSGSPWLRALALPGRMALSNYILQSVICTLLFNGYGLGQYGRVAPWQGVLLTLVIFGFGIWFSHRWLRRFRYGPLEWLWRSLTYRKLCPMRISAA